MTNEEFLELAKKANLRAEYQPLVVPKLVGFVRLDERGSYKFGMTKEAFWVLVQLLREGCSADELCEIVRAIAPGQNSQPST